MAQRGLRLLGDACCVLRQDFQPILHLQGRNTDGARRLGHTRGGTLATAAERTSGLSPQLLGRLAVLLLAVSTTAAEAETTQPRPGVPPKDAWTCPLTHPIKGNFTTYSGEPCIYHVPGGQFYSRTKPERCYATEADAVKDGCRRSKR